MPLQFQLSDAKTSRLKNIAGVPVDSAEFVEMVNDATRQLMKRGSWYGTEVLVNFCVYGCDVVFPRYVGTVIGAKACHGQTDIKNHWYHIVGGSTPGDRCGVILVDNGEVPCYNQISGTTGKKIAYHVVKNSDIGKTCVIYGFKYGGQPLQERDSDGNWRMGVTITATSAGGATLPAMTTEDVVTITHVVREATAGMCYLYEYDGSNLVDLAVYEPNETNPMYRRMRIKNLTAIPGVTDDYGRTRRSISCIVHLQHVPVVNDNDFLLIDDFDALAYAVQARKKEEANDDQGAETSILKAVRELNMLDRSKTPGQQLTVKVNVMGSSRGIVNPI